MLVCAAPVLVLAALVALYLLSDRRAEQALQEAIAEADRLDPGWRIEELEASRKAIAAEKNAGLLLTRIGPAHLTILNTGTLREGLGRIDSELVKILDPRVALTPKQTADLRAVLKPLGPILIDARKVADMSEGRYAANVRPELNWLIPNADRVYLTVWLLWDDVMLRIEDRDMEGAWISCQAALNVGSSLGDEPLDSVQIRRCGDVGRAIGLMERTLAQGLVAENQLAATQDLLRDELRHPALLIALRGSRGMVHHSFSLLQSGRASLAEAKRMSAGRGGSGDVVEQVEGFLGRHEIKPAHAWLLRYTTEAVEIGKRPEHDAMPALMEHAKTVADAPALARSFAVKFDHFGLISTNRALLRCAMAGLAVERFRLLHDRWPATLEEVVAAKLLAEVPVDPFDGMPLRWRLLQDGVVVYSIGSNGLGNGRVLDADAPDPMAGRVEFRLWNVDRRRS